MGFFQDLFGDTAAKAATDAANQKIAGLNTGLANQTPYYNLSRGDISTGYGGAINTYTPGYDLGVSGAGAYGDVTGANGVAGQDRARALFQTDPGYQFSLDQAQQATERLASKYGQTDSGNLIDAATKNAVGYANQAYNQYVQRLAPFLGYSALTAGQLGGAQTGQGTALAGLDTGQGQNVYNTAAGVGSAQAAGTLGAAQARTAAAGNIANLGVKLLGYAAAPFTGGLSAAAANAMGGNEFGISDDELYGVGARALQA